MNAIKPHQPSFKGASVTGFVQALDFAEKATSRNAVMFLYTGCILSRLVNSRDKYEFRETALRDSLGWGSLFFASAMAQKVIAYGLERFRLKGQNLTKEVDSIFKTSDGKLPGLLDLLNPRSSAALRNFNDIKALNIADSKLEKVLYRNKAISYFASLGIAISILGIFIPRLNTKMTEKDIKAKKLVTSDIQTQSVVKFTRQYQKSQKNLTMEGFLNLSSSQKVN